jgi:tRNA dimethylallyltransferase
MVCDPQVLVIVGPTCSGKTRLSLEWAQRLQCEIINFDSRQVYRELDIGVARPHIDELSQVKHHLIATHSLRDPLNASHYSTLARSIIQSRIEQEGRVILVGGTGLYLKALLEGLDDLPETSESTRNSVLQWYEQEGLLGITSKLFAIDNQAFNWIEKDNPARVMRALEICITTGLSVEEWRKKKGNPLPYSYKIWGIETPRNVLYERINERVDAMLEMGFVNEVRALHEFKDLWVMKTVGYQEFFDYLDGKTSWQEATDKMKQKTRNYAKRQITWFKNQVNVDWNSLNTLLTLPTETIL